MNRSLLVFLLIPTLLLVGGCSGKLSRRQAKNEIDSMLKPHPVGPKKTMSHGGVPGFELQSDDLEGSNYFTLDDHKPYGSLAFQKQESPDSDIYLLDALSKIGYVSVEEGGPMTIISDGTPLSYSHSHTVRLTPKVGTASLAGSSRDYSSGFHCYPDPAFDQCDLPPLIEVEKDYKITGIVGDETHAKVNILIPYKLTPFGLELKPYAAAVAKEEDKFGMDSKYMLYPALYRWEHFLNSHQAAGGSPATVLFQKFDDGWRIVDENGKSEEDFL